MDNYPCLPYRIQARGGIKFVTYYTGRFPEEPLELRNCIVVVYQIMLNYLLWKYTWPRDTRYFFNLWHSENVKCNILHWELVKIYPFCIQT